MYNAELYHNINYAPRRDALQCLEENIKKMQWNHKGDTAIDLGCGDGSVTVTILKQFLPKSCKRLLGCDISENMVQFANKRYANATTSFEVLDIEGDLPDQLRGKFDHAFSFYALQWLQKNEKGFSNIYNMLAKNGDCLLMFLGRFPVFDVYRLLARQPKWSSLLKDVDRIISVFHDCQNPGEEIRRLMENVGFTNIDVHFKNLSHSYTRLQFKNVLKAITPFKIPEELLEEYTEDFIDIARSTKHLDSGYEVVCGEDEAMFTYQLFTVYGRIS